MPLEHLVIGQGEVGKAISKVFNSASYDLTDPWPPQDLFKYLHICFPWSEDFILYVQKYKLQFKPDYTIIHSTVPVGTCRKLNAVSSPIRGLHPNLYEGIMTFPKFMAGDVTNELANEFRRAGLKIIILDKPETAELGKLLDTEYYRACIEFAHDTKMQCLKWDVPFHEVYTLFNQTYNEGYTKLGHPEYVRPVLQAIPGDINGHCVIPNSKLL